MDIDDLRSQLDEAKAAAHSVPMNKMYTTHTGRRFLGTHSMAWAAASREVGRLTLALRQKEDEDDAS